jgi:hypothetical protein
MAFLAASVFAGDAFAIKGDDGSEITFKINYRYEYVDVDGMDDPASTLNADITLGYKTKAYEGLYAYFETETVANTFLNDYNSTSNNKNEFPVVADPDGSEINQMYFGYAGDAVPDTKFIVGRQRVILGNSRHVGNVGWRLNEMTYDAAVAVNNSVENLTLIGAYTWNANSIFGTNILLDTGVILDATYNLKGWGKFNAFSQLYDFADLTDSATYGARFFGGHKLSDSFKALYEFEYAMQTDFGDRDDFTANYFHAVLGGAFSDYYIKGAMEYLGSDDGVAAFSFPTGTNHAFNGWADQFLGTPDLGLMDIYGVAGAKFSQVEGLSAKVIFHDFSSIEDDVVSGDTVHYGTEFDGVVTYKYDKHHTFGAKFAMYTTDDERGNADVTKAWFWSSYNF